MSTKKRVIILSARGFVGGSLFSSLSNDPSFELIDFNSDNCNLLDPIKTMRAFQAQKEKFSLVFLSTFGRFPHDDFYVYDRNKRMAENLVAALQTAPIEHVIFTSTACIYGRPPIHVPITEATSPNPSGFYGLSKYLSERLLQCSLNVPVTILRLPGTYGVRDNKKSVIGSMINQLRTTQAITITDDGNQKRDFLYIEDLYPVIKHYLLNPKNELMNVSSGDVLTIRHVAEIIAKELNQKLEIKHKKLDKQFDMYYDISYMKKVFPELKLTSTQTAIKKIIAELK